MVLGYTLYLFLVPWIGFVSHWICAVIDKEVKAVMLPCVQPPIKRKDKEHINKYPEGIC